MRWLDAYEARLKTGGITAVDLKCHMKATVEETMNRIRFPMMSPRTLAEMLLQDIVSHHKEYFVTRLAMGMSFHSGQVIFWKLERVIHPLAKSLSRRTGSNFREVKPQIQRYSSKTTACFVVE